MSTLAKEATGAKESAGSRSDMLDLVMRRYGAEAGIGDLMANAPQAMASRWRDMLTALSADGSGFAPLQARAERQVLDLGMAFRLAGEADERAWPLSPVPLLIQSSEWQAIERGMAQRAGLLDSILADIYGPQMLIADGSLPAAVVAGSRSHWRLMNGVSPPKGRYLQFYAADLARGPNGEWRVLADYTRTPTGAGYALENRLAMGRVTGDLLGRMNVRRLAPFFAAFRQGLASSCERVDPRIALLTPGRFNQSYAEQAHLARYLGLLLVEGEDLAVAGRPALRAHDRGHQADRCAVAADGYDLPRSAGVRLAIQDRRARHLRCDHARNFGGCELARRGRDRIRRVRGVHAAHRKALLGESLLIPNIATWWCGQPAEHDYVLDNLAGMAIAPAFGESVPGLEDGRAHIGARLDEAHRVALFDAMERRPMDYVGQELVQLSTTPAIVNGALAPPPVRRARVRDARRQRRMEDDAGRFRPLGRSWRYPRRADGRRRHGGRCLHRLGSAGSRDLAARFQPVAADPAGGGDAAEQGG